MPSLRNRILPTALLAGATATLLGVTVAPAVTAPPKITAQGVGQVTLGKRHSVLRTAGRLGPIQLGCELAGPQARSAKLRSPLRGSVDLSSTMPRKVTTIVVRGGAKARGVGVGSTQAHLKLRFPKAVFDHSTDMTFGITIAKIPKSGGGRLQFAVDTTTKKVTLIGIPRIPFCE